MNIPFLSGTKIKGQIEALDLPYLSNPSYILTVDTNNIISISSGFTGGGGTVDLSDYFTKDQTDNRFQPLENQRLSTSNEVEFNRIRATTELLIPSTSANYYSIYVDENGLGGTGVTPSYFNPIITNVTSGQTLVFDGTNWINSTFTSGTFDYNALSNKPTLLSHFTNDLGNYGNWITQAQANDYYQPIGNYLVANDLAGYYTKAQNDTIYKAINWLPAWNEVTDKPDFSLQFQPLENQRLSSNNEVEFNKIKAINQLLIPSTSANYYSIYVDENGIGGTGVTPSYFNPTITSPTSGQTLVYNGSQWINSTFTSGTFDYNALSNKPTLLSQFINDLGNYGNWLTAGDVNSLFQALENQRLSTSNAVSFTSINSINGGDIALTSGSNNDIGDIVFFDSIGEKHRIWDGGNFLNYRYRGGDGYELLHKGNVGALAMQDKVYNLYGTNNSSYYLKHEWDGTGWNLRAENIAGDEQANIHLVNINGSARQADNTIKWNDYDFDKSTAYSDGFDYLFGRTSGLNEARLVTATGLKSFLGLPSNSDLLHSSIGFAGGYPSADANTVSENTSSFTYANNAPYNGYLGHFGNGGYGLQLNATYISGDGFAFRTKNGDTAQWNNWKELIFNGYNQEANLEGRAIISGGAGTVYNSSDLEIRGYGRAPNIGLHWAATVASNITIESSGRVAIKNNPGTSYENFIANQIEGTQFKSKSFWFTPNNGSANWIFQNEYNHFIIYGGTDYLEGAAMTINEYGNILCNDILEAPTIKATSKMVIPSKNSSGTVNGSFEIWVEH